MGDSAQETQEGTRLLGYATAAVSRYLGDAYDDVPADVVNEAVVRLAGYSFDAPYYARVNAYAGTSAMRNSGAASVLSPFRVHRAGSAEVVDGTS